MLRFLCSEEDEGFSTEPVANKQNGGPLGFYFNQKVHELRCKLTPKTYSALDAENESRCRV